ncbi:hypothetical protein [Lacrimispora aerotolerans]|uniref:hypothetical protein n=1 Tax=Lacrimispora aerotolerans TaxID=36832 RepID=UPI00047CD34E|nr:hypothetical protein [Lacrimispora aerotolerans]
MDLDQQLKNLSQKYLFEDSQFKTDEQIPSLEVCLTLQETHIDRFIEKAGQLNSIIESCANMVSIFDTDVSKDYLMQTSIRCGKSNHLYIRTAPSMLNILVETLFD